MSWHTGFKMVTDGLVLYLDAGNPRSYPGTGNIWYDLSRYGANMVMYNGPTFTNNNASSYLTFDGGNDYGLTTVSVPDSNDGDECCFECMCYGPMTNGTMLMAWGTGIHDIFISNNGIGYNTYNSDVYGISTDTLINRWVYIAINFYRLDYTQGSIYIDGVEQSLSYYNSGQHKPNAIFANGELRIASGGNGYNGNFRFNTVKVYNRALNSAEVLQNYNALNWRY